jgi:formate/nitrite transporter FocA (FNT family)
MGMSLVAEGLLRAHLPQARWTPLVAKLGYSFGYLLVVLGRQQLFTENTLTVMLPLLARRNLPTLKGVLRLWAIVLIANLAGVHLFIWVISHSAVFHPDVKQAFTEISAQAAGGSSSTILLKGVFAGWLIALMVWLLPAADSSRIAVVVIVTYVVGLGGFTHVVAGSLEVLYNVTTGAVPYATYLVGYLLPTLAGNIVGGVTLTAVLNHAQVVAGNQETE